MHWVVQNNMFAEEGFERLVAAIRAAGAPLSVVKVVPFSHDLVPDIQPPDARVVVMGTYSLVDIARRRGWYPGSFDNANFDFALQAEKWPGAMLNGDFRGGKLRNVPEQAQPFFIRPVHDTKSFVGHVTDWPTFSAWRDGVLALRPEDQATVTGDTEVVVAAKKEIYNESRIWVVDGRFVTGSLYKVGTIRRDARLLPGSVIAGFVEELARTWAPARAFVVDVATTARGLKVVEVNNLNCAGFYAGDMDALVAAIERMDFSVDEQPPTC